MLGRVRLILSPDGAVVAFVAQKGASGVRSSTCDDSAVAGHGLVGDRRRRRSVLFAGRPVDRVFRRRQAEEDRRHGRRGRHAVRCAERPRRRVGEDGTIVFLPNRSR